MSSVGEQRRVPSEDSRYHQTGQRRAPKHIFHYGHQTNLFQQLLTQYQVNGKDKRTEQAKHITRQCIVCQVITPLRQYTEQRTAKAEGDTNDFHQRSPLVQEENRDKKHPDRLQGIEDGTADRRRLTDAQQIAKHKTIHAECPQAK